MYYINSKQHIFTEIGEHYTINWWSDRFDGIWQEHLKMLAFLIRHRRGKKKKRHRRFWNFHWKPAREGSSLSQHQEGTHPAIVIVIHRVQVPLEELVLRRDQHVASQAVSSLDLLEEVLLANSCWWNQVMWDLRDLWQHVCNTPCISLSPQQGPHFLPAALSRDSIRTESETGAISLAGV